MENESFIIAMEAIKDCFKHNINIDKARKSRRIFKNRRWRYIMNKRKVQFI